MEVKAEIQITGVASLQLQRVRIQTLIINSIINNTEVVQIQTLEMLQGNA